MHPAPAAAREPPPELARAVLFASPTLELADVRCRGTCRHRSAEECTQAAQLVFPYRGTFVRHLGRRARLADANQVLFFGAAQPHQVSHPVTGGDSSLVLTISPEILDELAPVEAFDAHAQAFRVDGRTLAPAAQLLRTRLATRLAAGVASALEVETGLLALARASLGPLPAPRWRPTRATRQLVERTRAVLAEAGGQRLALADIGRAVGASPVYLTQVFAALEGVPLYRYQLQLRLATALARLHEHGDLAALALDLGFSSHGQLSTHFRAAYGLAPSHLVRELALALKNREAATAPA